MSLLARLRPSVKWIALATGLACLVVGIAGVVPHDEGDGSRCLVCKARQESLEALPVASGLEAPPLRTAARAISETFAPLSSVSDSGPARAPPA